MAQDHSVFSNIQDNRTSSLAEQVADQINQVIIDQNINAGEKLPNEFELAARLNVGRGTIREAVKLLVARNCLEIRRGKGTFVVEKPGQIEDPLGFAYVKDKITLAIDLMELRLNLPLRTGVSDDSYTEIKSGLQEDDTVAYDTSSVSDDYYSDSYSDSIW